MDVLITPEDIKNLKVELEKCRECAELDNDIELAHLEADDALLAVLAKIDPEIPRLFRAIPRWYS